MEALDAVLVDSSAIDRLLAAFSDPAIALAYGRQPPRHGAFPIEAHARLFNYPSQSSIRILEDRKSLGFKKHICFKLFCCLSKEGFD